MTVETLISRPPTARAATRPSARGKFLFLGDEKLYVRGVTYGTFRRNGEGHDYHDHATVERDFALMAASGLNAVRTYTVPPRWLLDVAEEQGLFVMVGLPWEQHVTFLDDRERARSIERGVAEGVRACAGHPAVLSYSVGNEIPASIVRWHGRERVQRYLRRLYEAAKEEDPEGLVTYVNFPSTEYLDLPFFDLFSFNVYLESQKPLQSYLARLHNLAGDKPVLMAELGLDSRRNGEDEQARTLRWQLQTAFESGCAGAFVFAWTDEWHRGGHDIEDWDFGLTDRWRRPKPALEAVSGAFDEVPLGNGRRWPRMSVVVCTHNGAATLRWCLEGVAELDYPDYETIVVDDGSTDDSARIADEAGVRLISTENRGLASARNTGFEAADGEIVAYLDDDARPDPHWLTYLATTFMATPYAGVGGPNIPPDDDCAVADCVANAPGGPVHVLLSDTEAEHIPGCNMAFRKSSLEAIDGFDRQFRAAGDDVDVCWRLQERGFSLGFNPAAVVWHRRRDSVRAYWRQQLGYGRAEALLERKWPEKYNSAGHLSWHGRLYGLGIPKVLAPRRWRVYYGTWGSRLFQSVYEPAQASLRALPLMPEWYLLIAALAALSALGAVWRPLLLALPALVVAGSLLLLQAAHGALRASFASRRGRRRRRCLTTLLYVLQPLARLRGRIGAGLTPWRRPETHSLALPVRRAEARWSEEWRSQEEWLVGAEVSLMVDGCAVRRGGDFDRWDLEVRGGMLGRVRLRMALEEHGAGRQLARFGLRPVLSLPGSALIGLFGFLAAASALSGAVLAPVVLLAVMLGLAGRVLYEWSLAMGGAVRAVHGRPEHEGPVLVRALEETGQEA